MVAVHYIDIIADVVKGMNEAYARCKSGIQSLRYYPGSSREILAKIATGMKVSDRIYPCVMTFNNERFEEYYDYTQVTLDLAFAVQAQLNEWTEQKVAERYKVLLLPLREDFLYRFNRHPAVIKLFDNPETWTEPRNASVSEAKDVAMLDLVDVVKINGLKFVYDQYHSNCCN